MKELIILNDNNDLLTYLKQNKNELESNKGNIYSANIIAETDVAGARND